MGRRTQPTDLSWECNHSPNSFSGWHGYHRRAPGHKVHCRPYICISTKRVESQQLRLKPPCYDWTNKYACQCRPDVYRHWKEKKNHAEERNDTKTNKAQFSIVRIIEQIVLGQLLFTNAMSTTRAHNPVHFDPEFELVTEGCFRTRGNKKVLQNRFF